MFGNSLRKFRGMTNTPFSEEFASGGERETVKDGRRKGLH